MILNVIILIPFLKPVYTAILFIFNVKKETLVYVNLCYSAAKISLPLFNTPNELNQLFRKQEVSDCALLKKNQGIKQKVKKPLPRQPFMDIQWRIQMQQNAIQKKKKKKQKTIVKQLNFKTLGLQKEYGMMFQFNNLVICK